VLSDKSFWKTPAIDSGNIHAQKRFFIRALSSRKVKLKCVDDNKQKIGLNNTMITTISTLQSVITGPPRLIKLDKEGVAYAVVQNCSQYTIQILKRAYGFCRTPNWRKELRKNGYKICVVTTERSQHKQHPTKQITVVDKRGQNGVYFKTCQCLCQLTNQDKMSSIKYFNIVRIDKNELGRVKNVFHVNHLKDNKPVCRKQFKIPDA
jgi:hypothetical protein